MVHGGILPPLTTCQGIEGSLNPPIFHDDWSGPRVNMEVPVQGRTVPDRSSTKQRDVQTCRETPGAVEMETEVRDRKQFTMVTQVQVPRVEQAHSSQQQSGVSMFCHVHILLVQYCVVLFSVHKALCCSV